jgi:hypothetical protein
MKSICSSFSACFSSSSASTRQAAAQSKAPPPRESASDAGSKGGTRGVRTLSVEGLNPQAAQSSAFSGRRVSGDDLLDSKASHMVTREDFRVLQAASKGATPSSLSSSASGEMTEKLEGKSVAAAQNLPGRRCSPEEAFHLAVVNIARQKDLHEADRSEQVMALRSTMTDSRMLQRYLNGLVQVVASPHAPYDLNLRASILKALSPGTWEQVDIYRAIISRAALSDAQRQHLLDALPTVPATYPFSVPAHIRHAGIGAYQ